MTTHVLVAYATRYGSTREVAEAVAETLRKRGLQVDLRPMKDTRTLEGYGAVVLGAPLYLSHWHKDAPAFLARHRGALERLPVAVFALGPLSAEEGEVRGAREQLDRELARYPWLRPVAVAVVVGRYDPARLGLAHTLLAALPASPLHGRPASDGRDWAAIRAWAGELSRRLEPVPVA